MKLLKGMFTCMVCTSLLVGCSSKKETVDEVQETVEEKKTVLSSVKTSFDKKEFSEDPTVEMYYVLPVIEDDQDVAKSINKVLESDLEAYQKQLTDVESVLSSMPLYGMAEASDVVTSRPSKNGDGILSLRYLVKKSLPEVQESYEYGMTFDLLTGRQLTLSAVSKKPEAELKTAIEEAAKKYVTEDLMMEYTGDIQSKAMKDISFYMTTNTYIVCFKPGELTNDNCGITLEFDKEFNFLLGKSQDMETINQAIISPDQEEEEPEETEITDEETKKEETKKEETAPVDDLTPITTDPEECVKNGGTWSEALGGCEYPIGGSRV